MIGKLVVLVQCPEDYWKKCPRREEKSKQRYGAEEHSTIWPDITQRKAGELIPLRSQALRRPTGDGIALHAVSARISRTDVLSASGRATNNGIDCSSLSGASTGSVAHADVWSPTCDCIAADARAAPSPYVSTSTFSLCSARTSHPARSLKATTIKPS